MLFAGGKPAIEDLLGALGQNPGQASSSTQSNLADLLGNSEPTTSSSSAGGAFADLLSQSAPSSSPHFEPITAYEKDGIRVVFRLSKPAGQESVTDIEALYSNTGGQAITDFSLQVGMDACSALRDLLSATVPILVQQCMQGRGQQTMQRNAFIAFFSLFECNVVYSMPGAKVTW